MLKKHILRDRRQQVDNYDYTHIKGETHISLKGPRKTELRSDDHLTINADSHVRIGQQWLLMAGTEIHVASGARILLEAGAELTVKAGGSWIKLDASGVSINGKKIYISGGCKAGMGTPARPLKPEEAVPVDTSIMPKTLVPSAEEPQTEKIKSDGELRIGIFFDGTGCHKDWKGRDQSNIAKLFGYYQYISGKYHKIYVRGIGVKLTSSSNADNEKLKDSYGDDIISLMFGLWGEGGNADIIWNELIGNYNDELADIDTSSVKCIILDVFGFSRGASLARHFVNAVSAYGLPKPAGCRVSVSRTIPEQYHDVNPNMITEYSHKGEYYAYEKWDCEIKFGFIGLFDTVGSFYYPGNFDEGNFKLLLPSPVLSCTYQIAAADEYRDNFGLYTLKNSAEQDDMPGCHSDIGGGYVISDKKVDIDNNRHGITYILLGSAEIKTWGEENYISVEIKNDSALKNLCEELFAEFVANNERETFSAGQIKAGIRIVKKTGQHFEDTRNYLI